LSCGDFGLERRPVPKLRQASRDGVSTSPWWLVPVPLLFQISGARPHNTQQ
jgi:hypothetical protein